MGRAIAACAEGDAEYVISAECDAGDDPAQHLPAADAVIDFSHRSATASVAALCATHGKPGVVGTTGQDDAARDAIARAAQTVPIVFSPNFSVGVNTLFALAARAAAVLGGEFDLEVVEMHHRMKKDAPSGTARRLLEILAEARGLDPRRDVRHGREGLGGERPRQEIGMHTLRGGDVVGDHTVIFAGSGERIELTHRASSRDTFARGALRAAAWALAQPPGLYDMQDVLGLRAV